MERKKIRGSNVPKKKFDLKMFIAKNYLFLILVICFVLGVAFPGVVAFQGIATGVLLLILAKVCSKGLSFVDSLLLKWASPSKVIVKTPIADLDQVIDSPEKLVAIAKMMSSLRSEDEFFNDRDNESEE